MFPCVNKYLNLFFCFLNANANLHRLENRQHGFRSLVRVLLLQIAFQGMSIARGNQLMLNCVLDEFGEIFHAHFDQNPGLVRADGLYA